VVKAMKKIGIKQVLIPSILIAFVLSLIWNYTTLKSFSSEEPVLDATLEIIPDYKIISGKALIAWPKGTVFEQGMASYFYAAEPVIHVAPIVKLSGFEQGKLDGVIKSEVFIQVVDDKSQIYWSYKLRDYEQKRFTLSNDTVSSELQYQADNISLDINSVYNRMLQISNELMFQTGVFQMVIHSNVNVVGIINHIEIERTITQTLPITLQQAGFTIPKTQELITQVTFTENNISPNLIQRGLEIGLNHPLQFSISFILFIMLGISLIWNYRSKSIAYSEHRRYKDWITEGSVEVKDRLMINILSLEGLVDLAIDLDKRVIYDARVNKYYVLTEDITYIYDRDSLKAMLDNKQHLGKLLIDNGLLKPEQLEIGLYYQKKIGSRLGESLIALGFIDETTLYSTLAAQQKIDYYEMDPKQEIVNTEWLSKMSIQKARTLMSLPLGTRSDGRLVIACSESSREGVQNALQEIFGSDIYLVFTKPSAIHERLDRIDTKEKQSINMELGNNKITAYERLSEIEREQFLSSFYRGNLVEDIYLKATGILDSVMLSQVPAKEGLLSWAVHHNRMDGELASLMIGLSKAIETLDWKARKEKQLPELLTILKEANYLTPETEQWINREVVLQGLSIEQLLYINYIASKETIKKTRYLLDTLESILNGNKRNIEKEK
jgi:hypothetical protein